MLGLSYLIFRLCQIILNGECRQDVATSFSLPRLQIATLLSKQDWALSDRQVGMDFTLSCRVLPPLSLESWSFLFALLSSLFAITFCSLRLAFQTMRWSCLNGIVKKRCFLASPPFLL